MCKWNSGVTGEQGVENCFGYIEVFLFETLLLNVFGKSGKGHV